MRASCLAGWIAAAILLCLANLALAFTPPPIQGHVTDLTGKLTAADDAYLESRLDVSRTGAAEIAVLVLPSLGGEAIEDVAYATFDTWGIGRKELDNGVLIVIATGDRRIRIETGKGAGGVLTDVQANEIIRQKIGPLMKEDRLREAIDAGGEAVVAAFRGEKLPVAAAKDPLREPGLWVFVAVAVILTIVGVMNTRSGGGGGDPSGWRPRGGSVGGGSSSGGSSGGYSGGGGRSGGGGSSGSYRVLVGVLGVLGLFAAGRPSPR